MNAHFHQDQALEAGLKQYSRQLKNIIPIGPDKLKTTLKTSFHGTNISLRSREIL